MSVSDLFAWKGSNFKSEEPTRYERKRDAKAAAEKGWVDVCRTVDTRDGRRCRACGRRCDPSAASLLDRAERHHIIYRSAGGVDESWCLVTLCQQCHLDEHRHKLKIDGNADNGLTFYRRDSDGSFYISRQETAPHVLTARD